MIKFKVFIYTDPERDNFLDKDVSINIELPSVPQVDDILYLKRKHFSVLEEKAKSSLEIAERYAPEWFYCHSSGVKDVKKENLKDLNFEDAMYVKEIVYTADDEFVCLILYRG